MGKIVLDLRPDGRVLVALPERHVPLGVTIQATAAYPSLRAFLVAKRSSPRP